MLERYFELARTQIEGHGGVVEKFIGDAVVGVFGVPAAREDDPERAVRAGLRICEGADALRGLDGRVAAVAGRGEHRDRARAARGDARPRGRGS